MKLILACPTYGPTEPQADIALRAAVMHATNNGHQWLGDSSPRRMKFDVARNVVAKSAVDTEADAVVWVDSDVILPVWGISRLAAHARDFICGIYFQRELPHWPLIANFTGTTFQWIAKWPADVIAPIDGCGFGCVITSTKLLRDIRTRYEDGEDKDFGWFNYKKYSEDFDFCLRAKACGYQLYVDTGVLCGHLPDPKAVTFETYKAAHPEIFGDNNGIRSCPESGDVGLSDHRPPAEETPDLQPAAICAG